MERTLSYEEAGKLHCGICPICGRHGNLLKNVNKETKCFNCGALVRDASLASRDTRPVLRLPQGTTA